SLFDYAYGTYERAEDVTYDKSDIGNSQVLVGVTVKPFENERGSGACPFKFLHTGRQKQETPGSLADIACLKGFTDFDVAFCPEAFTANIGNVRSRTYS
ncbi:hypothetical protein D0864_08629, partial [Hortaea werneckii]